MIKIDEELLEELGLGAMSTTSRRDFLAHIYQSLEMKVGMTLAARMTDQQLDEFELLIDANDEEGCLDWLTTNMPDYGDVVHAELNVICDEVRANRDAILSAEA